MQDYTFENTVYGRELTMTGPRKPTPEEVEGAYAKKYGGDLIFDEVGNTKSSLNDIKADYKRREGKEFKGSVKDLVEEEYEYWNMVDNNLGKGAWETATVFKDMSKEEKQRTMRRYDVYDRTNMTGDGSRDWFEQLKGVGGALVTDPFNYVGGVGLYKLAAKTATKGLGRTLLQKALFPAAVGAAYGAGADVERQTREIALEARDEVDPAQVGTVATASAVLNVAGPAVVKGGANLASGAFKLVSSPKFRETVRDKALKRTVDTFGGSPLAQEAAVKNLQGAMGEGNFGVGQSGAQGVLGTAVGKVQGQFVKKYEDLGELNVSAAEINGFVKAMISDGVDIPNVTTLVQDMERGLKTPTTVLRKLRQYIGDARYKSGDDKGPMASQSELATRWDLAITDFFTSAAERAGKGKEAVAIDKEFSKFQKFRTNSRQILTAAKDPSGTALGNRLKAVVADPSKSLAAYRKLEVELRRIAKFSGDDTVTSEMRGFVQQALKETFFENKGSKIIKFAKSTTGLKTLKQIFPDRGEMLDDFGMLVKRVQDRTGGVPLYWARLIPMMLSGSMGAASGASSGIEMAAATTAGSMYMMTQALESKVFRKMALKAYESKNIDTKAVNGMVKWLDAKGFKGEGARDALLGTISLPMSGREAERQQQ